MGPCSANGFAVFRRPPPAAPDPSLSADRHVPDTGGQLTMATVSWLASRSIWSGDSTQCWTRLRGLPAAIRPHLRLASLPPSIGYASLRAPERIDFEIAVLTYKVIHGLVPVYLGPFTRVADHPVGPQNDYDLSEDVTSAESLTTFRRPLKTHLFKKSFLDYLLDMINWLSSVDQQ